MVDTSARPKVQSLLALFDQKDDQILFPKPKESDKSEKTAHPPLSIKPVIKPKPTSSKLPKNASFLEDLSCKLSDSSLLKNHSDITSTYASSSVASKTQPTPPQATPVISEAPVIKPSSVVQRNPSFLQDLTNKIKSSNSDELLIKPASKLVAVSSHAHTTDVIREENKSTFILDANSFFADKFKKLARRKIPSEASLGPAPDKPSRPDNIQLPISTRTLPNIPKRKAPSVPNTNGAASNLLDQDLYEDAAFIPEYTEEQELQDEELYNDTSQPPLLPPLNNRLGHPPFPPAFLDQDEDDEEIYQDIMLTEGHPLQEEMYEIMPCDQTPMSSIQLEAQRNNYKLAKEREERLKKEQKELKKREKEMEKMRKKFGLGEDVVPVDAGLVKVDNKGGRNDLEVYRGETVLILRMENNPTGKWLAKNEKGKIGYVDVTNLEVDAGSVKSVMTSRRNSKISEEPLYNDAFGPEEEEESIYEVPY